MLNKWATAFRSRLTPPEYTANEQAFVEDIKADNRIRERSVTYNVQNEDYQAFSVDVVTRMVNESRGSKSPGPNAIINKVLKNTNSIPALTTLPIALIMELYHHPGQKD